MPCSIDADDYAGNAIEAPLVTWPCLHRVSGAMALGMAQHRTILPEAPPSPEEIRDHLARAGMSQLAFAAWCGSTPQAVRKWLTDRENSTHREPPRMLWFALWAAVEAAGEDSGGQGVAGAVLAADEAQQHDGAQKGHPERRTKASRSAGQVAASGKPLDEEKRGHTAGHKK